MQAKSARKKVRSLRIIIVGCGKVGHTLTEQLVREGHDITIVDTSERVVRDTTEMFRRDGHSRQRREPERVDGRRASGGRPGDRGHGFGRAEPALLHNRQKGRRRAGGHRARAQSGLQRGAAVSASAARIIHDYQSGAGGRAGNRASAFPAAGADGQLVCQGARRAGAFQDSERKHPARASRHAAG